MNVADTERAATGLVRLATTGLIGEGRRRCLFQYLLCQERAERKVFRRINEVRAGAKNQTLLA